jgi:hypothetical protein
MTKNISSLTNQLENSDLLLFLYIYIYIYKLSYSINIAYRETIYLEGVGVGEGVNVIFYSLTHFYALTLTLYNYFSIKKPLSQKSFLIKEKYYGKTFIFFIEIE